MAKITIGQMQKLSELESRLSKKEVVSQNLDFVEQGSPLDAEIKRMQMVHGTDLSGLPPGHPLLKILAEAKQRYEARQNARQTQAEVNQFVKKQVQKVQPQQMKKTASDNQKSEEVESARVLAAHKVNKAIEQTDDSLRRLMKEIIDNEALINTEHVGKLRLYRLKRMADAMRRLLGESKIPGARA